MNFDSKSLINHTSTIVLNTFIDSLNHMIIVTYPIEPITVDSSFFLVKVSYSFHTSTHTLVNTANSLSLVAIELLNATIALDLTLSCKFDFNSSIESMES